MVVISGVELVSDDDLLWAAQRGSERLRLIADEGVRVRRVGESIGGIYASGYAAAQMSIINPTAYVSIVRKRALVNQLHYIALLPRGAVREMGTKRDVLLLAKTGEPLALQLTRLLWDDDDFG
jgi:hypothetical protein